MCSLFCGNSYYYPSMPILICFLSTLTNITFTSLGSKGVQQNNLMPHFFDALSKHLWGCVFYCRDVTRISQSIKKNRHDMSIFPTHRYSTHDILPSTNSIKKQLNFCGEFFYYTFFFHGKIWAVFPLWLLRVFLCENEYQVSTNSLCSCEYCTAVVSSPTPHRRWEYWSTELSPANRKCHRKRFSFLHQQKPKYAAQHCGSDRVLELRDSLEMT